MNKYTVIYSNYFIRGSNNFSITTYKHITCEPDKIIEIFEQDGILCASQIWFVLEGHSKLVEEF